MGFYNDSKKILNIAIPLLSSRLMNVIVFFAGFIMIAKLGRNEFAASALGISIFSTLIMICVGMLYAIGIKISHAFGAKQYDKVREYFYSGIVLAVLLSVACVIVMIAVAYLLPYFGQKPQLIPDAKQFLFALCLPVLPSLLNVVGNQLVIGLQRTRIILIASIVDVPVCLSLLYAFIFGKFGAPRMGVWGFGISYLLADIMLFLFPVIYAFSHKYFRQFKLTILTNVRKNLWERLVELVRLGLPMGVQFGAEMTVFAVSTFLIGFFGATALAAYQIATQILVVALMIPFTMSEAAAILVGQALGMKDEVAIRRYGFSSCKLGIVFFLCIAVLFLTCPKLLTSIYINIHDPKMAATVHLSVLFLYIAAINQLFDGVRNIITGALRGLHDSKSPMYIGIFVSWCISLPLGILFAFPLKFGPIGFAIAAVAAFLIGAVILLFRFHQKTRCSV